MAERFDAVIVGGGPSGALAALLLARSGWRTALVERGARHRVKACGHCLAPRADALLRHADLLEPVARIASGTARRVLIHHEPEGPPLELSLASPGGGAGHVVERSRLDQVLIDAAADAGVEVMQPAAARIESIDASGAQVRVDGTERRGLRASLLVGADGICSGVARAAGLGHVEPVGRKYGFSFDASGPSALAGDAVEMFVVEGGYLGAVTQGGPGGRRELHLGGLVGCPGEGRREPIAFVRSVAERFEPLRASDLHELDHGRVRRFDAAGPMPARARRVAGGPVALVGDAAGYREPFTGEGMTWALQSAIVLEETVAGSPPGCWSEAHGRAYERAWARRIARRQRLCRLVAAGLERRWTVRAVLRPGPLRSVVARLVARRLVA